MGRQRRQDPLRAPGRRNGPGGYCSHVRTLLAEDRGGDAELNDLPSFIRDITAGIYICLRCDVFVDDPQGHVEEIHPESAN